jgi:peptidoglycan/LPS O-acetylase OafA/YrhL
MVVLSHFVLAFQPALLGGGASVAHFAASVPISRTAAIILFNPELGVAIFFVISGYVMAASASRATSSLPVKVARRWARLALPVLATSVLIWPLAQWHLFRSVEAAGLAKSDWLAGNYAWLAFETNDFGRLIWQSLADLFLRSNHFYNAALWTMPTEFWGSVALFAAAAASRRIAGGRANLLSGLRLTACVVVLGFVWSNGFFGFACGAALFEAARLMPAWERGRASVGVALFLVGVLLGGMPYLIDLPYDGLYARLFLVLAPLIDNPVLLLHRLAALSLVAATIVWRPLGSALERPLAQYLGRISFMLYLVHVPIICSMGAWLLLRLVSVMSYNVATLLLLPVFLLAAIAFATLCALVIDEPLLHAIRRLNRPDRSNCMRKYAVLQ